VQTFLPFNADFNSTAKVLDNKRLGKQRVENLQILKVNSRIAAGEENVAWRNHPAVKMWRGHSQGLFEYHNAIVNEWLRRGYSDTTLDKAIHFVDFSDDPELPLWLFDPRIGITHQFSLWQKDPVHYRRFFAVDKRNFDAYCCARCNYFWPTHTEEYK
jgi:hypothetical protein